MSIKLWKYILKAKDLCERFVSNQKCNSWQFPGGPVAKTPHFYYQGSGFNLWSGSWDPGNHLVQPEKKCNSYF